MTGVDELPYRRLVVWQKAHRLAMEVVEMAELPAFERRFAFRDQMMRAALSVSANIAEGQGRGTTLDFAGFVDRARGSLFELDVWLFSAAERGWITPEQAEAANKAVLELNAMLYALRESLRAKGPAKR